jgi:hypothetical protein
LFSAPIAEHFQAFNREIIKKKTRLQVEAIKTVFIIKVSPKISVDWLHAL